MCFNPKYAIATYKYKTVTSGEYKLIKDLKFCKKIEDQYYNDFVNTIKPAQYLTIPCRKCLACRISKANDWATRCILESREYKNNSFVTLSYNPKNLPENGTLVKRDLQLFMKRLRKEHTSETIRYFACGEYGDKTLRAHYHIGFFNYKPKDLKFFKFNKNNQPLYLSKELAKIWGKGFIIVGELTIESAGYIARYTQKKIYNKHDKIIEKLGRIPEFILTSRRPGIGMNYIKNSENFKKIKENFGILIKQNDTVKIKNIPETIRKKWREIDELEYYEAADRNHEINEELFNKKLEQTSLTRTEYMKMQNEKTKERLHKLKRETF